MSESPIANPALSPNNVEIMRVYLAHASSIWRIKSELSCPWKTLFSNCTRNERPQFYHGDWIPGTIAQEVRNHFQDTDCYCCTDFPKSHQEQCRSPWNDWIMTAILPWDPKVAFRMALSLSPRLLVNTQATPSNTRRPMSRLFDFSSKLDRSLGLPMLQVLVQRK